MKPVDWGRKVPTTPKGHKPETIQNIKNQKTPAKSSKKPADKRTGFGGKDYFLP